MWDPDAYARYGDERSRPFFELLARVRAERPAYVVDAGCGSGELTAALARRWPEAEVLGFDSSPAMVAKARERGGEVTFTVADVTTWHPDRPVDVLVSNAVLQWVPGHRAVIERWVEALSPGGWLAFQVPGNHDAPSHRAIRELCASPAWADRLGDHDRGRPAGDPIEYLDLLSGLGCRVDAWETTYVHVLRGEDPVLGWVRGTALRPVLDRLDEGERERFTAELAGRLARAYPSGPYGTPFPFRRVFAVAQR
ncbi:trans-aconitate 2-methyltransferase [Nonomuraea sp. CA-218870]|uniref:trans-aconitate 2-methyltransferase n=1 Tax=Nonomuraea sp. CA-218870 TaxID=3239998 RepID=UPI003D8D26F0